MLPALARAIYAPIPEQEQGKALSYRLGASAYHDSNIFGGATGEISSMVYNFNGEISFNGSVDDQTFVSASYGLSNDHVVDRPGKKNLTSHAFSARWAHSFSPDTNIDLNGGYNIAKNPQSLLSGVPLNSDQSYKRAELDGRFTTTLNAKTGLVAKYRFVDYAYDNSVLSTDLDRTENLFGLETSFQVMPETKLVGEYRHQDIAYSSAANLKDKKSNFFMAGFDYSPGKQLMVSSRAGFEARKRKSASNTTAPYVELTSRYTYAEGSFLAAGYVHTIEEPSDVARFTDTSVNRFFVNLQHQVTGAITLSGSVNYEPSQLQGRPGVTTDIDEKTTRFGLAATWRPDKNWTVSATFDYDKVDSDDASRGQDRNRLGVSASLAF